MLWERLVSEELRHVPPTKVNLLDPKSMGSFLMGLPMQRTFPRLSETTLKKNHIHAVGKLNRALLLTRQRNAQTFGFPEIMALVVRCLLRARCKNISNSSPVRLLSIQERYGCLC